MKKAYTKYLEESGYLAGDVLWLPLKMRTVHVCSEREGRSNRPVTGAKGPKQDIPPFKVMVHKRMGFGRASFVGMHAGTLSTDSGVIPFHFFVFSRRESVQTFPHSFFSVFIFEQVGY